MIVDAHVHIFPQRVIADRKAYPNEKAFNLLYTDERARLITAEELIESMDRDGIAWSVVCSFPWLDEQLARGHNDYILEAAAKFPDRLVPLAGVTVGAAWAEAEAARSLENGAAGLGELAVYHGDMGDDSVFEPLKALADLCAQTGKPLLLHCNEPVGHQYPGKAPMGLKGLYDLVKACPKTRFQLAHLGGGLFFFELLKKEVRETLANCVYDLAAAPYLYRPDLYNVFKMISQPDRLVYGSDQPLLGLARYKKDLAAAGVEEAFAQALLGDNAARFWKLT